MHYVYVILSNKRKWLYIGCTDDLKNRFNEHQTGQVKSTKGMQPFKLVYYEVYASKKDARTREINLKNNSSQKEFLYKQIANSADSLAT